MFCPNFTAAITKFVTMSPQESQVETTQPAPPDSATVHQSNGSDSWKSDYSSIRARRMFDVQTELLVCQHVETVLNKLQQVCKQLLISDGRCKALSAQLREVTLHINVANEKIDEELDHASDGEDPPYAPYMRRTVTGIHTLQYKEEMWRRTGLGRKLEEQYLNQARLKKHLETQRATRELLWLKQCHLKLVKRHGENRIRMEREHEKMKWRIAAAKGKGKGKAE